MHIEVVYDTSGHLQMVAINRALNRSTLKGFEKGHKFAYVVKCPKEMKDLPGRVIQRDFRIKSVLKNGMVELERVKKTR